MHLRVPVLKIDGVALGHETRHRGPKIEVERSTELLYLIGGDAQLLHHVLLDVAGHLVAERRGVVEAVVQVHQHARDWPPRHRHPGRWAACREAQEQQHSARAPNTAQEALLAEQGGFPQRSEVRWVAGGAARGRSAGGLLHPSTADHRGATSTAHKAPVAPT